MKTKTAIPVLIASIFTIYPVLTKAQESRDSNIKELDPDSIEMDRVISVKADYTKEILYDKATQGSHCFITCDMYIGTTSKWSNFYVDIQPYESTCLLGCSVQYPMPPKEVILKVNNSTFELVLTDADKNRFYIPLEARKKIAERSGDLSITIPGAKMSRYQIGSGNGLLIAGLVNTTEEKPISSTAPQKKSKEERLTELDALFSKGMISKEEYKKAREKILSD